MKKYVYMMTGNEVWFNAAKYLYQNKIAKPILWLGDDRHFKKAKEIFSDDVLLMDTFVHYQENINQINYIDEKSEFFFSDNYLRAKDRCLKMMDRLDLYGSFSRQDREVVFNKIAIFLLKKLSKEKPDALVMAEIAHSHAQYLVLEVCMFLNIEIVKFNTWMLGPLLYLENLNTGNKLEVDFEIDQKLSEAIEKEIHNYVDRVVQKKLDGNFELDYMKNQRLSLNLKNKVLSFISSGWIDFIKEFWFQFRKNLKNDYYQINPYRFGFYIRSKVRRNRKSNLTKEHNRNIVKLDLSKRFAYFALHFEPERTTNPDGGVFHDQFLAILSLRKILPKDIKIVVKEHPSQFYIYDRGSRGRSSLFYNLIKNIEGVELAGFKENSFQLISKAEMTATISGTVALEAAIIGKKSLIFGNSWFNNCPNVISWRKDLSYESFIDGDNVDPNDIKDFLIKNKRKYTVIGCQNTSAQKTHGRYLDYQHFSDVEFKGVTHLLEQFFKSI